MTSNGDSLGDRMNLDGCLEWKRAKSSRGYGQIWVKGKLLYVHRYVWELSKGSIPAGMLICHKCDNPSCYRVSHLFLGNSVDNSRDMARKGRQVFQVDPTKAARGERHGLSVLTADMVREIRNDNRSQRTIAAAYGIAQATVSDIRRGKIWSHVK